MSKNGSLDYAKNDSSPNDPTMSFFLISPFQCELYGNRRPYCVYATLLVLVSYTLFAFLFGVTLYRMNELIERFRNQYNLSLIWLYSILLIFCIDLLEFVVNGDPYVHSRLSIVAVSITLCFLVMLCLRYFDLNHLKEPHFYRGMFGLAFTLILLIVILVSRVWAASRQSAYSSVTNKNGMSRIYMLFYQIVLLMFGSVQIYENTKANMARIFTNLAYVLWISACALQTFYLSTLPSSIEYDYIFYRVYLMFTTLLFIIMQELVSTVSRAKQKLFEQKYQINSIALKQMDANSSELPRTAVHSRNFKFVERAFQNEGGDKNNILGNHNDEEEIYSRTTYSNMYMGGQAEPMTVIDDYETRATASVLSANINEEAKTPEDYQKQLKWSRISLILAFSFVIIANVILLTRVTFTLFSLAALLVNPIAVVIGHLSKRYS